MSNLISRFLTEEDGATAIEYGLIASLIAVAIIVALQATGTSLTSVFENVSSELNTASSGDAG